MNKKLISLAASAVISSSAVVSMNAWATTVDDVAAVARQYGYTEDIIQSGYSEYYSHPEDYPSDRLDVAIQKLNEAGSQIVTTGPQVTQQETVVTTVSSDENNVDSQNNDPDGITLTASDGTTFTRISREAFINMSYDEKMAYLSSFTPAQQQAIIDDLSPLEYRSLMKQSPAEQKIKVVDKLSEAAEEMGINITVDELTDDSITLAMRNDNGELINVSKAGVSVEDTGYDRRGIVALACSLICAAVGGVYFLMRRLKEEGSEQ
jgi:hypothetical protein